MFCKQLTVCLVVIALGLVSAPDVEGAAVAVERDVIHITASGSGTYFPATGLYVADGETDPLGQSVGTGRVETTETGPGTFSFQSWGTGTRNAFLDRFVVADGTMFLRFDPGTVVLIPDLNDPNFDPLIGPYTAQWEAVNRVVSGTGRFKAARGTINVTATNLPFLLTDLEWQFTWTWDGVIRTPRRGR